MILGRDFLIECKARCGSRRNEKRRYEFFSFSPVTHLARFVFTRSSTFFIFFCTFFLLHSSEGNRFRAATHKKRIFFFELPTVVNHLVDGRFESLLEMVSLFLCFDSDTSLLLAIVDPICE